MLIGRFFSFFLAISASGFGVLAAQNTLYIIRNAETGPDSLLSDVGKQRASECLPEHFVDADLGLIISCQPSSDSLACHAAEETVSPLATAVGVDINTSCDAVDILPLAQCIRDLVSGFSAISDKSILIVWDRMHLSGLLNVFGLRNFPSEKADAVFTLRNGIFLSYTSQSCDALDPCDPLPPTLSGHHDTPSPVITLNMPAITPPVSPTKKLLSLDLYYTTTIMLPDPTPTTNVVLLRESKKKRRAPQKLEYVPGNP
ncbi:hypothetical protein BJ165DRAFT_1507895 [Panaeolus papilionaceus]|nr:hypothetical protein BJ165DRAFT_1507895 [Panaeolus papilionaceus]